MTECEELMRARTCISKIEAGRRPVTDVELVAICKALDVDPGWLLGWEP